MNILVGCEESQAVTIELRKLGHNAFSCDIIECSGGHPEWHIMQDVIPLLNGKCTFSTMDGNRHEVCGKWDMIIAFPPCTFLTVTGNRWFNIERYGEKAIQRHKDREAAIEFFMAFANADCPRIVIENPVGHMSTAWRKPDQIIHPYYFAEAEDDENCERKSTCLWLIGVEPLKYEIKYKPRVIVYKNGKGTDSPWHVNTMGLPKEERAKMRSKTFPGIARAIAEQMAGPVSQQFGCIPDMERLPDSRYDDALIGVTNCGRAVYDYDKMVECLIKHTGWAVTQAVEWIEYNIIGALPKESACGPLIMYPQRV